MIASKVNKLSTYKKEIRENENYISILKKVQIVSALLFAGALFLILAEGATSLLIGLDISILSTIMSYGLSLKSIICIGVIFLGIFSTALVVFGCLFVFGVLKSNSLKRQNKNSKEKIKEEIQKSKTKKVKILKREQRKNNTKFKDQIFKSLEEIFQSSLKDKLNECSIDLEKLKMSNFEKKLKEFLQSEPKKKDFIIELIKKASSHLTEEIYIENKEKYSSKWLLNCLKDILEKDKTIPQKEKDEIYKHLCKAIFKYELFYNNKEWNSYLLIYNKIQDEKIKKEIVDELYSFCNDKICKLENILSFLPKIRKEAKKKKSLISIVNDTIKFLEDKISKDKISIDLVLRKEFKKVNKNNLIELIRFIEKNVKRRILTLLQCCEKNIFKEHKESNRLVANRLFTMAKYLYEEYLDLSNIPQPPSKDDNKGSDNKLRKMSNLNTLEILKRTRTFLKKAKELFRKFKNKDKAFRSLVFPKYRNFLKKFNKEKNGEKKINYLKITALIVALGMLSGENRDDKLKNLIEPLIDNDCPEVLKIILGKFSSKELGNKESVKVIEKFEEKIKNLKKNDPKYNSKKTKYGNFIEELKKVQKKKYP